VREEKEKLVRSLQECELVMIFFLVLQGKSDAKNGTKTVREREFV
jgi:hypothetical protein